MAYLGNTPTTQNFVSGTDYFNGTGSQTAFTLSRTVNSVNDIQVTVNNVVQQPNDAYTLSGTTLTMTSAPSAGTNNVYVRYISTTTQSIAPSQNSVGWNQLTTDTQQDLGISFKNRIINGNMVIDQRNAGAAVTANGAFPVDRFTVSNGTDGAFSAQQDSSVPAGFTKSTKITITTADTSLAATQQLSFLQRIEGFNVADLNWGNANAKTVTLSFWVRSSLTGTFGGALRNNDANRSYPFTYSISVADTWEYKTVTIAGDTSGTWATDNNAGINLFFGLGAGTDRSGTAGAWNSDTDTSATGAVSVVGTLNATWYITGVQFEVGTQATTFTTAGGSYGAELALCQRYYAKVGPATSGIYPAFGTAGGESSTAAFGVFTTPVTMRSTPTFSSNGTPTLYSNGFSNITSFGTAYYTTDTVAININVSGGGLTVGRFYNILSNNDATSFVQFNSEL